jgi:hypothetical protein
MRGSLKRGIVLFLMLFAGLSLTLVNYVSSEWPCEVAGPTNRCVIEANRQCNYYCGGAAKCSMAYWLENYCWQAICYESWGIECKDGRYELWDCMSLAGPCPH